MYLAGPHTPGPLRCRAARAHRTSQSRRLIPVAGMCRWQRCIPRRRSTSSRNSLPNQSRRNRHPQWRASRRDRLLRSRLPRWLIRRQDLSPRTAIYRRSCTEPMPLGWGCFWQDYAALRGRPPSCRSPAQPSLSPPTSHSDPPVRYRASRLSSRTPRRSGCAPRPLRPVRETLARSRGRKSRSGEGRSRLHRAVLRYRRPEPAAKYHWLAQFRAAWGF